MISLKGKHNSCKIFTDNVDNETISQLYEVLNQESVAGSQIRIMPDCHAGKGCVVGTTMTLHNKVIPNLVGVDISCGMLCCRIETPGKNLDLDKFDKVMHKNIKSGFEIYDSPQPYAAKIENNLHNLKCADRVDIPKALRSIGSIGGGNHFVEIDKDEYNNLYIVIHCGSRHLGLEVCDYYQNKAYTKLNKSSKNDVKILIDQYKKEGRQKEIAQAIKTLKNTKTTNVPKDLCYLEDDDFNDYIHDMEILENFAYWNRKQVLDTLLENMGLKSAEEFTTTHNYVDTKNMILRKGSIDASLGKKVIIPMNMKDGSLICTGKGNADWNFSAPHGAGRLMSRSKAKKLLSMDTYETEMSGIYSTCINSSTLDEAPMAYKPMQEIINCIQNTVEINEIIRPIYNFKASE